MHLCRFHNLATDDVDLSLQTVIINPALYVCVYFGQAPPLLLLPSSLLLQLGRNDKVQCEYAHFTHRLLVSFKYEHIMHTNFQNVCVFHLLKWKCVYAIPLSPLLLECVLRMWVWRSAAKSFHENAFYFAKCSVFHFTAFSCGIYCMHLEQQSIYMMENTLRSEN